MKHVFISHFSHITQLAEHVRQAMAWIGIESLCRKEARVFIKPNLTWTEPTPGVTTTPQMLEALVVHLRERTPNITIVESNGGQNCFAAEEAFKQHGVYKIAAKYGAHVVNLSHQPSELASTTVGGRDVVVELPSLLLHEMDVFITLPVPKVHIMTGVSMAFKNQWGCQPDTMRLRNHPQFAEVVIAINKLLKPKIAVFDGTYFLDRTGPMIGEAVPMNLLIVSDDIGAGSMACCQIMGIDPKRIKHFRLAQQEGMFPASQGEIVYNRPPSEFANRRFRLERTPMNWVQLIGFNHRWANRLLYDSLFADPLHQIVYLLRRNALVSRLLYGEFGPGEAKRHSGYL